MTTHEAAKRKLWLVYLNDAAYRSGLISERERDLLKLKILAEHSGSRMCASKQEERSPIKCHARDTFSSDI